MIDELPKQLGLVSVSGATPSGDGFFFDGVLAGEQPPLVDVAVDPSASPFGYVPLAGFGPIDVGATDESIANFGIPSFEYAGMVYNTIGIVSNGYIVVGGGTGADVDFVNSDLPDASPPNNVLAPFWTDLNPSAGGRILIAVLTDGFDTWTIVEWESVPNFGDRETNTAQVWIGTNSDADPSQDIFFVYGGDVSDGDSGSLTVGAENSSGSSGGTTFFDGAGTPPAPSTAGYEVDVLSTPGSPGETKTIEFTAIGAKKGKWQNCAEVIGDTFFGVSTACESGEVKK